VKKAVILSSTFFFVLSMAEISFAFEKDAKMVSMSFRKKAKLGNDAR